MKNVANPIFVVSILGSTVLGLLFAKSATQEINYERIKILGYAEEELTLEPWWNVSLLLIFPILWLVAILLNRKRKNSLLIWLCSLTNLFYGITYFLYRYN